MKTFLVFLFSSICLFPLSAGDREVVEAFYSQLLSAPNAKDLPQRANNILVTNWVSTPTPVGGVGAEGFVATLRFFGKNIPDLTWKPQEILKDGDRYIVRSVATGTPKGKFFGKVPNGKSFEIMSIDIHQVKNGKIVRSYHVEDWARALRQVTSSD